MSSEGAPPLATGSPSNVNGSNSSNGNANGSKGNGSGEKNSKGKGARKSPHGGSPNKTAAGLKWGAASGGGAVCLEGQVGAISCAGRADVSPAQPDGPSFLQKLMSPKGDSRAPKGSNATKGSNGPTGEPSPPANDPHAVSSTTSPNGAPNNGANASVPHGADAGESHHQTSFSTKVNKSSNGSNANPPNGAPNGASAGESHFQTSISPKVNTGAPHGVNAGNGSNNSNGSNGTNPGASGEEEGGGKEELPFGCGDPAPPVE